MCTMGIEGNETRDDNAVIGCSYSLRKTVLSAVSVLQLKTVRKCSSEDTPVPVHGPSEDGRRRVEGRRTGPEDLLRHTRPHERVWVRGRLGEGLTAGSHTAGVTGPLWSDVVRGTTRHKWDKRQRIKDQHGEREIDSPTWMIITW